MLPSVPRTPHIPRQLKAAPFTLADARRHGLTPSALRSKAWRRIGFELYCWEGLRPDPWATLAAWARMLSPKAVFAGKTAAWMLGLDFQPTNPIEVNVPSVGVRSRPGLSVRHCQISWREVRTVRGLRSTNVHRTLRDFCATLPPVEALVAIDMALHRRLVNPDLLHHLPLAKFGAPAESAMETRLRWLLIQAGLPRPDVQTDLRDGEGRFLGRADLYYPSARLVLEYDGGNHRERLVADDRRQNLLINAGFRVLRFTAIDVHQRADVVVGQVRAALLAQDGRNAGAGSAFLRKTGGMPAGVGLASPGQQPTWFWHIVVEIDEYRLIS